MQKSLYEVALEVHQTYQKRLVENMVNVIYFKKQTKETKKDSQERVDAIESAKVAQQNVKNDKLLMESFEELLQQLQPTEAKE